MDALNLRVLVNLSGGTGEGLKDMLATIAASPAPDRMVVFANLDFSDIDAPGYGRRAAARLEADIAAGARGSEDLQESGSEREARERRARAARRRRARSGVGRLRAAEGARADPHGGARSRSSIRSM